MTDLERFFCRLVEAVSAIDPAHLQQPIPLAEIRGSIMPYRSNRRPLHLDSSEDYELVLMRLCAGEGGFASVSPDEARARFKLELASSNPDLTALRQFGEATIMLAPGWVAAAMSAAGDADADPPAPNASVPFFEAPKPPAEPETQTAPTATASMATASATATRSASRTAPRTATRCSTCSETLPEGDVVRFCPYCGTQRAPDQCTDCGTKLEAGWRFCAACGQAV